MLGRRMWISVGSLALSTPMQNELPGVLPAYASCRWRNCCAACATRSSGAFRWPGCAASSPTCRAPLPATLLHPEGRRRAGRLRDVPQPRRGARLGAARRHAGRGARPADALRAARPLPAHGRGHAPGRPRAALRALPAAQGEAWAPRACSTPKLKRALPPFPGRIGVVTSLAAAALRDVLTTLARRNPAIPVIVYPVPVQGEGAAERIVDHARARQPRAPNATCCCWCAAAARSRTCGSSTRRRWRAPSAPPRIPVVVGVGHETDFTIADFAADQRAPTPTAAAELACPARAELAARVADCATHVWRAKCGGGSSTPLRPWIRAARRLVHPAAAPALVSAIDDPAFRAPRLRLLAPRAPLPGASRASCSATLVSLDPTAVLERGYSITTNADGAVLRDASKVRAGERLQTRLARGDDRQRGEERS